MQVCIPLQTDNQASTSLLKFFTGRMPFLPPNQQCQIKKIKIVYLVRRQHLVSYRIVSCSQCFDAHWLVELLCPRRRGGGIKQYRDPSVCVSVCLSHGAAALGTLAAYSLATCGLWTRPRTDVDPPRVERPSAGAYRLAVPGAITC